MTALQTTLSKSFRNQMFVYEHEPGWDKKCEALIRTSQASTGTASDLAASLIDHKA